MSVFRRLRQRFAAVEDAQREEQRKRWGKLAGHHVNAIIVALNDQGPEALIEYYDDEHVAIVPVDAPKPKELACALVDEVQLQFKEAYSDFTFDKPQYMHKTGTWRLKTSYFREPMSEEEEEEEELSV